VRKKYRPLVITPVPCTRQYFSPQKSQMASLSEQSCAKCATKGGSPSALSEETVAQHKATLCTTWTIVNSPSNDEGQALSRSFVCRNFTAALDYLNRAGVVAEAQGHHPDLHITAYRTVTVVVYTHSTGGLCLNDFILASKLDQLEIDFSPKFVKKNAGVKGQKKE
jgi:4a-hydroxytetrahydrobiopterin dehydratase